MRRQTLISVMLLLVACPPPGLDDTAAPTDTGDDTQPSADTEADPDLGTDPEVDSDSDTDTVPDLDSDSDVAGCQPPVVAFTLPEPRCHSSDDAITVSVTATDPVYPSHSLSASVDDSVMGVIHAIPPMPDGRIRFARHFPEGERALTASVTNACGLTSQDETTFRVACQPAPPSFRLLPAHPTDLDDIVLDIDDDPACDHVTYQVDWSVDGNAFTTEDGVVRASDTQPGQTWEARVTAMGGCTPSDAVHAAVTVASP